jgi:hypothetical protein
METKLTMKASQYYTNRRHADPEYNAKVVAYQREYRNKQRLHYLQAKHALNIQDNYHPTMKIEKTNKVIEFKI